MDWGSMRNPTGDLVWELSQHFSPSKEMSCLDSSWDPAANFWWQLQVFRSPQVMAHGLQFCVLPNLGPIHFVKGTQKVVEIEVPSF